MLVGSARRFIVHDRRAHRFGRKVQVVALHRAAFGNEVEKRLAQGPLGDRLTRAGGFGQDTMVRKTARQRGLEDFCSASLVVALWSTLPIGSTPFARADVTGGVGIRRRRDLSLFSC